MKIYFTASLRQKTDKYQAIVAYLRRRHHIVYEKVLSLSQSVNNASERYIKEWFREWSSYIGECDAAVIEGSHPSTIHIGFEIGMILARNKPVILLYQEKRDPVFVNELYSNKLIKSGYNADNLEEVLDWCFTELDHVINRRFTFFVSPEIDEFLNKVAAQGGKTRSEFIRTLIEREMRQQR